MNDEISVVRSLEETLETESLGVTVRFEGDAYDTLTKLKQDLGVSDEEAVVRKAVALLVTAQGKEVLLRSGGQTQSVRLWARRR